MTFRQFACLILLTFVMAIPLFGESVAASTGLIQGDLGWWVWALLLFGFSLLLGIVAVIAGVGGGVLFVPIVSALFPFHFDFVRGAGLMVALSGALAAGPRLLRSGLANLRLGLPFALIGSAGSVAGALIGLSLPTELVQGLLGVAIVGIVIVMLIAGQSEVPTVRQRDRLSAWLGIGGTLVDENTGKKIDWKIHRTLLGLLAFSGIGILAGMFGVGAGWANVPAFNLLLGAPLKIAVATSGINLAFNGSAAAWIYINQGAVVALIAVPSIAGMMIGTRIGAQILPRVRARLVRWIVIAVLLAAGLRSLYSGLLAL